MGFCHQIKLINNLSAFFFFFAEHLH